MSQHRLLSLLVLAAAASLLLEVVLVDVQGQGFAEPGGAPEQAAVFFAPLPQQKPNSPITSVVERSRARLHKIEGVHGVSEGRTSIGDDAVRVDVENELVRDRLPKDIDGYPVEVVVVPGGFGILPAGSPYTG
ncbi:MAG: hypothetical protein M3143_09450 [Actinomycetota bacterium]|nr:hypothetical protein [Actinomycetota bacterium]